MKLSVEELDLIINALDTVNDIHPDDETEDLSNKLKNKLDEIIGKKSRLLSNSELRNIGM